MNWWCIGLGVQVTTLGKLFTHVPLSPSPSSLIWRRCLMAGKVTLGLKSHWPRVRDFGHPGYTPRGIWHTLYLLPYLDSSVMQLLQTVQHLWVLQGYYSREIRFLWVNCAWWRGQLHRAVHMFECERVVEDSRRQEVVSIRARFLVRLHCCLSLGNELVSFLCLAVRQLKQFNAVLRYDATYHDILYN